MIQGVFDVRFHVRGIDSAGDVMVEALRLPAPTRGPKAAPILKAASSQHRPKGRHDANHVSFIFISIEYADEYLFFTNFVY
jgi:hypothetical protein